MPFDLTISRIGALAGTPAMTSKGAKRLSGRDEIITTFQEQMQAILRHDAFKEARRTILKVAQVLEFLPDPPEWKGREEPLEVTTMPMDRSESFSNGDDGQPPLIGLLPSKRLACDIEGMNWILRARPSVTACALQNPSGFSKLWWTFEGIPADPDPNARPTEKQVTAFISRGADIEKKAMPLLYQAYLAAVTEVTEETSRVFEFDEDLRIRINMTDNDDRELGVLFDALYFEDRGLDEIRTGKSPRLKIANEGLKRFEEFVSDVTQYQPDDEDSSVQIMRKVPQLRGLYYRHQEREGQTVVAGVARQAGIIPGFEFLSPSRQREERSQETLRTRSAARRLSALLAGDEVRALEHPSPRPRRQAELAVRLT